MVPCGNCGREFKSAKAMAGHYKVHTVTDTSVYSEANRKRWSDSEYRTKMAGHLDALGKSSITKRDSKTFSEACREGQLERWKDPREYERYSKMFSGEGNPRWNGNRAELETRQRSILEWRGEFKKVKHLLISNRLDFVVESLGYTARQLREHIVRQFTAEMSWKNWGTVWHIDHVTPVSSFEPGTTATIVNALDNLQPLTVFENLSKGSKVIKI